MSQIYTKILNSKSALQDCLQNLIHLTSLHTLKIPVLNVKKQISSSIPSHTIHAWSQKNKLTSPSNI